MGTTGKYLGITLLVLCAVARLCLGRSLLTKTAEADETGNSPDSSHKASAASGSGGFGVVWGQQYGGRGAGADRFWFNIPKGNGRVGFGFGDNDSPGEDSTYNYGWNEHGFSHHGDWAFKGRGGPYGGGEYTGGAGGSGHGGSGESQGSPFSWAGSSAMGNGEGYGYGYSFGGDTQDTSYSHSGGNGGHGGYAP